MFLDATPQSILVLGDIFLDYTMYGSVEKLANEAPLPVFRKERETIRLGGCGNVVQNLAALGCEELHVFAACGHDRKGTLIESLLKQIRVEPHLLRKEGTDTISKHRFFCKNKLMFRYDEEERFSLTESDEAHVIEEVCRILDSRRIDTILFSDYNKGFLTPRICQTVIHFARERGIFTCVDPKDDFTKYSGCTLFKPNRNEVQSLFQIPFSLSHVADVHAYIKEKVGCAISVITLGELGISAHFESGEYYSWCDETKEVNDVTGAGDIVNAILAYFYPQGTSKKHCLQLASHLATMSVQHVGTYTLTFSDLVNAQKYVFGSKLVTVDVLERLQRPLVFTNGCFDLVHEGHLSLLRRCKALAGSTHDVVVALNSDTSIQKIKGQTRPIRPQDARIALLNQIEQVDWIVVFNEETPVELLRKLHPDLLVKGGDYTLEKVLGREYVKRVEIVPITHPISSTKILETMQQNTQC